jgi:thymidine kinase
MAKLYFIYSTMNAGKSTALLQVAHNYDERGMKTMIFTANLVSKQDVRVTSRIGIDKTAQAFSRDTDFWETCAAHKPSCVLIDEAQFLTPHQVKQLARLVDEADIPVMCYGLRVDFKGDAFPGSAALLAWADTLSELKTICWCARKATMVVRVGSDGTVEREGALVEAGGNERYIPLCRRHFTESMSTGRVKGGWKQEA